MFKDGAEKKWLPEPPKEGTTMMVLLVGKNIDL